ncbi:MULTISPECIES: lysylphosphatidylglycerol synthase transmembrane domain-containing protein [unclassified Gemella]|uniref:lysylphosphatidylglycerol synthase transmembrane domain-containing protein n=1 Tax=unclassified Gemella TaxID=2624949 RepID=UPI001073E2C9|nr:MULTISPECIES: lysylphosphatidylglycerol synthase transmembrane domain-containing protein [unclassified Gemella]MBF0709848.1 flippase-like domain-containing protein [Gemella sp. GL1.1]MBF0746847.1 flippase-like domain-containing protein [Gemella sp. 19428wG2_WT2a]NYS27192.1 flippase-like domain-containing protein [Gemella sp. GL1]TFU59571.1 flippase-like domain-containing protein [Gemella sp. WT2a]
MLSKGKKLQYIIIFLALISITFYLLLKDYSPGQLYGLISKLNYSYLILGSILAFIYIICESMAFKIIFKRLGQKTKFLQLIKYSFIGFYFSAITPSSSGGQPMQMYFMKKDKIEISKSSLSIVLCLMGYQIALIILTTISSILNYNLLLEQTAKVKFLFILALISNLILLGFILGAVFSKRFFPKIIDFIFKKIINKIKFVKKKKEKRAKVDEVIEDYHRCSNLFKNSPKLLTIIIGIYILQLTIRFSITYIVSLAMNLNSASIIKFITIQALILFCVSSLPIPGGVGISEFLYITFFSILVSKELINNAALVNQIVVYYLPVLLGACIVIYAQWKIGKNKR